MATNTYVALDKVTVGTATPSITFTSINQGYTDLVVVASAKSSLTTTTQVQLTFNSDTTTNYSWTRLLGDGSAASSARASTQSYIEVGYIAGNTGSPSPDLFTLNIQNYSNATTYKTFLSRWGSMNAANQYVAAVVGLWRKTPEAITSLTLTATSANFAVGSTFSLYGISTVGDASPKATGGDVYSDATYWYHAFPMSANFIPNQTITADILVIAGGGGSGRATGGGGAGGVQYLATQSLTAQNYSVTIGAGGAGQNDVNGLKGTNSVFGSLVTANAGGVGSRVNITNSNGGSGGGVAIGNTPGNASAGTGGTFYGNAGAAGNPTNGGYGGGGGTGAAGGQNTGGNGTTAFSSWLSATGFGVNVSGTYYIAGGGGGQQNSPVPNPAVAGGLGGGGASGDRTSGTATAGTAGLVSSGSGAGGGGIGASDGIGANGGSGVVIVRYAK